MIKWYFIFTLFIWSSWASCQSFVEFKDTKIVVKTNQIPLLDFVERYSLSQKAEALLIQSILDFSAVSEKKLTSRDLLHLIKDQVKAIEKEENNQLTLRLPASLEVTIKKFEGVGFDIEFFLEKELESKCRPCRVELSRFESTPKIEKDFIFEKIEVSVFPKGSFAIPFVYNFNGKSERGVLTGFARVQKIVPVAARTLRSGVQFKATDIEFLWRDVTFKEMDVVLMDEILSSQGRNNIAKGSVIVRVDLTKHQVVQAGQPLKLMVRQGDLEVSMDAVAQQAGAQGDRIRVRIPRTNKTASALIVDSQTAEL